MCEINTHRYAVYTSHLIQASDVAYMMSLLSYYILWHVYSFLQYFLTIRWDYVLQV